MELFRTGMTKPKSILPNLCCEAYNEPGTNSLKNFLARYEHQIWGKNSMSLNGL